MRNATKPCPSPRGLPGSVAVLSIALCAALPFGTGCEKAPPPAPRAEAPPPAPPAEAAPAPVPEDDFANSITFMGTVVEISPTSITFESEGAKTTLPITPSTRFVALQGVGDIKPGANLGFRVSADRKRLLVLNGTWME